VARAETASLAFRRRGAKRVGDDRAQCPRTAAAIRATAEALIDLGRCARKPWPRVEAGTYIILGENVTGADDHRFSALGFEFAAEPPIFEGCFNPAYGCA
jgi:hypothetical protein